MVTELIVCPRCGASPSAPADAQGQYVCGYCGSRYRTPQLVARPVHVSPPVHAPPALRPATPKPSRAGVAVLIGLGLLVVLAGLAGVAAALLRNANVVDAGAGRGPTATSTATNDVLLGAPAPGVPEAPASATFAEQSQIPGYQSSFYVLGFVTNTSPFTIEKPKITAVLLDKSGKELATRDGFAEGDALEPKAVAPIKLLVSDPPAHASIKYEVVVRKASYIPQAASNLHLEILEAPHVTFGTSWGVAGKVINDGKQSARFVNILVQAFDVNNRLVGLDSTYVDGEAIAAGATARFRAMPLYETAPHHFKYVVAGQVSK